MGKGHGIERSRVVAEDNLGVFFKRRLGEAVVASSIPNLIHKMPCHKGIGAAAMEVTLRSMRNNGLIKIKSYPEGNPDMDIAPGQSRIKLTGAGRSAWSIPNHNGPA